MNRLAHEKSPYLLQHKDNPVDWFPWGTEAFEKAQAEDKPIFLSIGYSTCHWCHVMAHESFENPKIATLLNRDFICIKLDREERPDVDRLYMGFVQATTGSGGWPLSVWLTPQGAPFFGGTYFPPEDRHGRVGFPVLLTRIQEAWHARREDLLNHAHKAMDALRESSSPMDSSSDIQGNPLLSGFQAFVQAFDETRGGFGQAPKFPRPSVFRFLFRCSQSLPEKESAYAQEMALFSLREMGRGGIRDHLGGGFHRYSVDSQWHVPHFEKMLYDQAQLVSCFVDAFQITKDPFFEELTKETLDYLLRDLAHKDGGFFSAEDADSKDADGQSTEGAYYVWSHDEICNALTETEARMICRFYAISPQGNAPSEGDPMGEFDGKNILKQSLSIEEIAKEEKISIEETTEILTRAKQSLFTLRSKRKRPHLDDKILTAWNGLALSALARAGACFGNKEWITHAEKTAQFLHTHLYDAQTRTLYRSWREGRSDILGFAEDYAFLIQGLLDLYEATFQFRWLQWALDLQDILDKHFKDEVHGGYFNNVSGDALMPMRLKEDYDGAEPAANSVAASNLLRLARMFYAETWEKATQGIFSAFAQPLSLVPQGLPEMLSSFAFAQSPPAQVIFIGDPNHADFQRLTQRADQEFSPFRVALAMTNTADREALSSRLPQLADMKAVDGHATAYFCENFTCRAPIVER